MDPAKAIAGALFFFSGLLMAVALPFWASHESWLLIVCFALSSIMMMRVGAKAWIGAKKSIDESIDE